MRIEQRIKQAHPLRSLDGSISKEDANRVYDLVYPKLHEGTGGYFR